jgi:H+-transporting ATPase
MVWFLINDGLKLLAYKVLDATKGAGKPKIKAKAKARGTVSPGADATAEPEPGASAPTEARTKDKPEPQPVAEHDTSTKPNDKTATAALLDKTLRDVLLAGIVKDPRAAGHIVAEAFAQSESQPDIKGRKAAEQVIPGPAPGTSTKSQATDDHAANGENK